MLLLDSRDKHEKIINLDSMANIEIHEYLENDEPIAEFCLMIVMLDGRRLPITSAKSRVDCRHILDGLWLEIRGDSRSFIDMEAVEDRALS